MDGGSAVVVDGGTTAAVGADVCGGGGGGAVSAGIDAKNATHDFADVISSASDVGMPTRSMKSGARASIDLHMKSYTALR